MGRKRKNRKKKGSGGGRPASPEQLEQKAREALAGENHRQARSLYRKLVKLDRDRFLPGLVEASTGLCRALAEQGKISEARKVLDDLAALDASAVPPDLRVTIGLKRSDWEKAATGAVQTLRETGPVTGVENPEPADALVLRFAPPGEDPGLPEEIEADRARVQEALERISEEAYPEALEALRPVGLRSPFSHWKWFAKGLCAFHRGEDEAALKAFSRLPGDSVPARAAAPYRLLLEGTEAAAARFRDRDLLAEACRIAGRDDLAGVLPRAEYLWRAGRIRDAYLFLRKHLAGFPSEAPGIQRSLTDLFFKGLFSLDERPAERFLTFLEESLVDGNRRPPLEVALAARAAALYWEENAPPEPGTFREISTLWETFLAARERVRGRSPRVEAAVWAHLGDYFSEEVPDSPFAALFTGRSEGQSEPLDEERAEESYRKSLELDPDNRDTHFALLRLYEAVGDGRGVNRTLDEIIKRFPDDKEALHRAGARCMDRKAFVKGIKYLERALDLDPLDRGVRRGFVLGCIRTGARYANERRLEKFRALLTRVLERTDARSEDLVLGRACVLARWGIYSLVIGLEGEGRELLDRAFEEGGDGLRLHAFVRFLARAQNVDAEVLEKSRTRLEAVLGGPPAAEPARHLIDVLAHLLHLSKAHERLKRERNRLNAHLAAGLEQKTVSRELARVVVGNGLEQGVVDLALRKRYIRRMLAQRPEDPFFRLYRLTLLQEEGRLGMPQRAHLDEAREIRRLAEEERDEELVHMAQTWVSALTKAVDTFERLLGPETLDEDEDLLEEDPFSEGEDDLDEDDEEIALDIEALKQAASRIDRKEVERDADVPPREGPARRAGGPGNRKRSRKQDESKQLDLFGD
jgi:tetratricopeptide (TPR) repeat protein